MNIERTAIREWVEMLAWTAVAAGIFVLLIGRIIIVSGDSMVPTVRHGDWLVAERVTRQLRDFQRGDIVSVRLPGEPRLLVKRVVGIPFDSVGIHSGRLFLNGREQQETFLSSPMGSWTQFDATSIPEDRYFILGDNRDRSRDSRDPEIGMIPRKSLNGRVVFRIWPLDRFGPIAKNNTEDAVNNEIQWVNPSPPDWP